MREITLETKIADLLNMHPDMKNILISINPKFKKLNNPVLRRTIGKVAGVKQAAIVGGMDPLDLLNQLRGAVGQASLCEQCMDPSEECLMPSVAPMPQWARREPARVLNANTILDKEKNPLAVTRKALRELRKTDILLIEADFRPEPLVDEFEKDGYEVYVQELSSDNFHTFIKKS